MKYIVSSNPGEPGIQYGRYLEYLKTIREALPEDVYAFASDQRYFELNSPHTLHDAWLESVEIREGRGQNRTSLGTAKMTIKLLGQDGRRFIILEYEDVHSYKLEGNRSVTCASPGFRYADTFHGDVITHEVRLGEQNRLVHEIAFATNSAILVECRSFTHREEMLDHEPPG